jgi:hypothetical protein
VSKETVFYVLTVFIFDEQTMVGSVWLSVLFLRQSVNNLFHVIVYCLVYSH